VLIATVVSLAILHWPDHWPSRGRASPHNEQQLLAAIHAELAAGSSLRHAVAAAGDAWPEARRLALAGAPVDRVAAALASAGSGPRLGAAIAVAARSGGRAAAVFQRLADRAASDAELARQQRVLTTQARLSAAIVAGMPVLWMVFGGLGQVASLFAAGAGIVAVAGIAMELVGVVLVWRMAAS
jgi:Flp pilus assembly protein TadB